LLVLLPLLKVQAADPKTITLRAAHMGATKTYYHISFEHFAKLVEEKTNGGIKFEIFPAGSMLKGSATLEGVRDGLADMGFLSFAYNPGELGFSAWAQMIPFGWDWKDISEILKAAKGFYQEDLDRYNQKLLFPNWVTGHWFLKNPVDVNNPSLKGIRVRTPGSAPRWMAEALGAAVISMPSAEMSSAVRTGVVDGIWTSIDAYMTHEFWDALPHVYNFGARTMFTGVWWSINKDSWGKLPPEWQTIMLEAANDTEKWFLTWMKERDERLFKNAATKGAKVTKLTKAQVKIWKKKISPPIEKRLIKEHGEKMRKWIETVNKIAAD
jgi:TRAP-type C4-dicarboxylate transport system substrate-binding protein